MPIFVCQKELTNQWTKNIAIIRIVYDPRVKSYRNKIAELQNEYHCMIINVLKKYIDHHKCLELIVVQGKKERIDKLIALLKKDPSLKEIKFDQLSF